MSMSVTVSEEPGFEELLVGHVDEVGGPGDSVVLLGGIVAEMCLLEVLPLFGQVALEEVVPANGFLSIVGILEVGGDGAGVERSVVDDCVEGIEEECHHVVAGVQGLQLVSHLFDELAAPFGSGVSGTVEDVALCFEEGATRAAPFGVFRVVSVDVFTYGQDAIDELDEGGLVSVVSVESTSVGFPGDGVEDLVSPVEALAEVGDKGGFHSGVAQDGFELVGDGALGQVELGLPGQEEWDHGVVMIRFCNVEFIGNLVGINVQLCFQGKFGVGCLFVLVAVDMFNLGLAGIAQAVQALGDFSEDVPFGGEGRVGEDCDLRAVGNTISSSSSRQES